MKKVNWSVCDYDYTKTYPAIDYSEKVTESGLVLSMRQIYERYAAMGMDLLNGEFVQDDEDPDNTLIDEYDDDLDVLQRSRSIQDRETPTRRKTRQAKEPAGKPDAGIGDSPLSPNSAPGDKPGSGDSKQEDTKNVTK